MSNHPEALDAALARCESEPIQQIGRIQPHGMLLVLGPAPERRILQASENLPGFFASTLEACLGQPLASLIGADQLAKIEALLAEATPGIERGPSLSAQICSVFADSFHYLQVYAYPAGPLMVLEMEHEAEAVKADRTDSQFERYLGQGLWHLADETDPDLYFKSAASLVREITGFDRVMVYRFDPNWEGEVIAESGNGRLPSYLGNRFPANDIPAQARRLYSLNMVRSMADIEAAPVALQPAVNPLTGAPLDMTYSRLRSFSPVHVEYLRNMDVRASLSLSLLQGGRLWGLIACHHAEPREVRFHTLKLLEFVGRMIAMWLLAVESHERNVLGVHLNSILAGLLKNLSQPQASERPTEERLEEMLELMQAGGGVFIRNGKRFTLGKVPAETELDQLLAWLASLPADDVFQTNRLSAFYPPASAYADLASGLLVAPFRDQLRNCTLWFRPEKPRLVRWAGSPEKTVVKDRDTGLRVSPRTSFNTWQETWRERSEFWQANEIELAETLSHAFTLAMARQDDVTGLPSRAAFKDRLRQALAQAERQRTRLALAFLDLDKFKPINDCHGHSTGDDYLKQIAERMRHNLRAEDTVARWGGDEFVVLMVNVEHAAAARQSMERLQAILRQPVETAGNRLAVSLSIGMACYPEDAVTAADLVALADAAMYLAKQRGGDQLASHQAGE